MKADKEQLELAAKAAGMKFRSSTVISDGYEVQSQDFPYGPRPWMAWNPIKDDGDAMRLAVKLRLEMYQSLNCGLWTVFVGYSKNGRIVYVAEQAEDDVFAATRRAIVRAAAEIGKTL
jgi:hypothetical protein